MCRTLWLPCHTDEAGYFGLRMRPHYVRQRSTIIKRHGEVSRRKTAHEELEQRPLFLITTATVRCLLRRGFSLPPSLPSPFASAVPPPSGSSQDLLFNRPLDRQSIGCEDQLIPLHLTLGSLLHLCVPRFPHLWQVDINSTFLKWILWGLNELMHRHRTVLSLSSG